MKTLWRMTFLALAGCVALAGIARASMIDATVLIDRAANNKTLTVRFSGAAVTLVEMRVNGASVATRTVSGGVQTGETNFALDTAALEDGDNPVEIRAYDASGKLVGTQKTTLFVDRQAIGPVFLTKPKSGSTVQGQVEISVGFKHELKNIYVSFFVNDEFKSLRNYAPYTYLWDTSTVPNGWHEVQAWVVDAANQTFKTQRMRVFVNNPGGRTDRVVVEPGKVQPTNPELNPTNNANGSKVSNPSNIKSTSGNGKVDDPKKVSEPGSPRDMTAPGVVGVTGNAANTRAAITDKGTSTGPRAMQPKGVASTTGNSVVSSTGHPVAVRTTSQPGTSVQTAVRASAHLSTITINYGTRLPNIGNYAILLNNSIVQFDVAPRTQNGVPLTPFRHLFEKAGGKVDWISASKNVDANGMGMHIRLHIGDRYAVVNDDKVELELAPFIESGRTVVPLSFIKDTLDVDVQYDPNTGHVLITTPEKK